MIDFTVYSLRCRGVFFYLRGFQSSWHFQQLLWYFLWRLDWSVRSLVRHSTLFLMRCNTSMNTAANAGMRLQIYGVFFILRETYRLNEDVHPTKRCAQVWKLKCVLHSEGDLGEKQITFYSLKLATSSADNPSEFSAGITGWQHSS